MMLIPLITGIVASIMTLYFWQKAMRCLIAHQMTIAAIASIRAQKWAQLASYTSPQSIKWKFYGRRFMWVIGLEARKKLSSSDVIKWQRNVDQDEVLRLQAAQLDGGGSKELEGYLQEQLIRDRELLSPAKALFIWLGSSLLLAGTVILVIYAGARI